MRFCTVCGVRVVHDDPLLHMDGGTYRWSPNPVGHYATLDPAALAVWLCWAATVPLTAPT